MKFMGVHDCVEQNMVSKSISRKIQPKFCNNFYAISLFIVGLYQYLTD